MPRKQFRFLVLMLVTSLPMAVSISAAFGAENESANGCAVVELFTSEGCSSCPPADSLLADIVTDARKSGAPVFALAFHVDYWNRLGWTDRFSDAAYSQRQSDYSRAFKSDEVYTPQMIVNGTKQFVGSDSATAKAAIAESLAKPAVAKITLELSSENSGGHHAVYSVLSAPEHTIINVAVVERGLTTNVARGENGGRVLRHENVVRWFNSIALPPKEKGQVDVPILKDVNLKNASVVVYAQSPNNGSVLGAASSDFPQEHPKPDVKSAQDSHAAAGLRDPVKKEIAMRLVSAAENSTLEWKGQYGYIEYNVEGNEKENRGYTAGIIGFTSKTHDMLELVEYYTSLAPGNLLAPYLPALRKVDGTSSTEGLGKAFERDWKTAGKDPKFRDPQDHERDRTYFNPAVDQAQTDQLHALGQFIYYDAMVMHGAGEDPTCFGGIRAAAMKKAKPPSQGGDEAAYLSAFLDQRKVVMRSEQGHADTSRVDTMQRTFLRERNLELNPPLHFKVYGEAFTIDDVQSK